MKSITIVIYDLVNNGLSKAIIEQANCLSLNYQVKIICSSFDCQISNLNSQVEIEITALKEIKKGLINKLFTLQKNHRNFIKALKAIDSDLIIAANHYENILVLNNCNQKIKVIGQFHNAGNFNPHIIADIEQYVLKDNFKKLIVLSPSQIQYLLNIIKPSDVKNLALIPNFASYPATIQEKENYFISIASLEESREIQKLILAFAHFKKNHPNNYQLVIVGDGSYKTKLVQLVASLKLEKEIIFTGLLDKEALSEKLSKAKVYLSAANNEVCPFSFIDALSFGLPIIAMQNRFLHPLLLENNYNGFTVDGDDLIAYIAAMNILANQDSIWHEMSQASLSLVNNFSVQNYYQKINQIVENCLNES